MKALLTRLPAVATVSLLLTGLLLFASTDGNESTRPETDEPAEAMRREFEMTRDPKTNQVPVERLHAAVAFYAEQQEIAALSKTTGINFGQMIWTERGPNNVGGRTRAVIFDKNDATNKRVFAGGVGGGLWRCNDITAASPVWTPVNDQFANLAITTIAQDPTTPQTMYFGTGEGYYNGGAIRGGGIWRSTDGGLNWTRLVFTANNQDFSYVQKIVVNSLGHVYAACRGYFCNNAGGLLKSTNGGTSFTRVIGTTGASCASAIDLSVSDVEVAANGDLYASVGIFSEGKIFKSSAATHAANVGNSGTWTNITPLAAAGLYNRIELGVAPSNAGRVYALFHDPNTNDCDAIFTTSNGGTSWTSQTVPIIIDQGNNSNFTRGQAWYDLVCTVDPNNDQTVYIGGVDLLKSTNAGGLWTQITSWSLYLAPLFGLAQNIHADQHTLVFSPGSSAIALAGNDGGIYYSTDMNSLIVLPSWTPKNNGYNVTQFYSAAPHPTNANYLIGGTQDNGTPKFTAAGMNSTVDVTGGDGAYTFVSKVNGNNQIASYVWNNFYRSTNGGATFSGLTGSDNTGRFINPADLDHSNNILYSAGNANQLVRWSNVFAAATRTNLTVSIGGDQASAITVSPNVANTVYIGTSSGNIYRLTNANAIPTVTQIATGLGSGNYINSIDVWKSTSGLDDSMVVALTNYGINSVYFTANGSAAAPTWTDIDDNNTLQDMPVRWAIFAPGDNTAIFLATEVGVMATSNISGGTTAWTLVNNNSLPMVSTHMLKATSSGNLVAATHGRGLFTSSVTVPLALRLLYFDAVRQGNQVRLTWQVQHEAGAAAYAVERMLDGESGFRIIQEFEPGGQSQYSGVDAIGDQNNSAVYRLQCREKSGKQFYSASVRINAQGNQDYRFIAAVFPTITDGLVLISTGQAPVKNMRIAVINATGNLLSEKVYPYQPQSLDLSGYPAGTYILRITNNNGEQLFTTRIIKR